MGEFDSAWWKWNWAGIHAKGLKGCFIDGANSYPFTDNPVVSNYDPYTHCIVLTMGAISPPPPEWALRLGDVVANYSAALDHVAWSIYLRGASVGSLTEDEERRVYYPVARSDNSFRQQIKVRLPGATDADVAIVRRYQPDSQEHCLMVLKDSSNLDKHRALQVLPVHIARSQLTINHLVDCELVNGTGFSLIQSDPMQPGAEIGRFPVTPTGPNPQAYMNGSFGMEPSINSKVWLRPLAQRNPAIYRMPACGVG